MESKITDQKILLVAPTGKVGGKASFTRLLLSCFKANNVDVNHIDYVRARSRNKIIRVFEHTWSFFWYKLKICILLGCKKIDIVQLHSSSFFDYWDLSVIFIIARVYRKRLLVRFGGGRFYHKFYQNSGRLGRAYIRFSLRLCDRIIVQSAYWSEIYQIMGVPEDKIYILPNMVDDGVYYNEAKEEDGLSMLFMPGSNLDRKGYNHFSQEIETLARSYPGVRFYLVGEGLPEWKHLSNVIVKNDIDQGEKIELFRRCKIYVLPTFNEGFPNSLIEAMASGMAILTTDIPEIKCLVGEDRDCLLIPPGDRSGFKTKMEYLFLDRDEILRLGKNARLAVMKKYSTRLMVDRLRELYAG